MRMAVWVALGRGVTWLLGAGLNGLVIVANGGHMPVYARVASGDQLHLLAGAHVALGWLREPRWSLWMLIRVFVLGYATAMLTYHGLQFAWIYLLGHCAIP